MGSRVGILYSYSLSAGKALLPSFTSVCSDSRHSGLGFLAWFSTSCSISSVVPGT